MTTNAKVSTSRTEPFGPAYVRGLKPGEARTELLELKNKVDTGWRRGYIRINNEQQFASARVDGGDTFNLQLSRRHWLTWFQFKFSGRAASSISKPMLEHVLTETEDDAWELASRLRKRLDANPELRERIEACLESGAENPAGDSAWQRLLGQVNAGANDTTYSDESDGS